MERKTLGASLLHQGLDTVPIPGTKRRTLLRENSGAVEVRLSPADLEWVDNAIPPGAAAGNRYGEQGMRLIDH